MKVLIHWMVCSLFLAAFLGGCSSMDKPSPHIGSLESAPVPGVTPIRSDEARKRAMEHFEAYLQGSPDAVHTPEALKRLADLNLEKEQDEQIRSIGGASVKLSKAAQLYQELLNRYPDQANQDQLLYQLARAHDLATDTTPSMLALDQYANQYVASDKYDEVQFRRGEYLFIRKQYKEAEDAYEEVIRHGDSSLFYLQALYKLGWSQFKQQKHTNSLRSFVQLLDNSPEKNYRAAGTVGGLSGADKGRLQDTLRVVSLNFSYLESGHSIQTFFTEIGTRSYEPIIYEGLATLLLSKQRFTDAAETYRDFSKVHPNHKDAPLFQSRVIDIYKQAGFTAKLIEEKRAYVEQYEPASKYWRQSRQLPLMEVLDQVQRHLRDLTRNYHAQAQNLQTKESFVLAGKWYELYLASFSKSEQAPYMNFLYAELLTKSKNYTQAAMEYERTAYEYGSHEKAAEAGYAAVLAFKKQLIGQTDKDGDKKQEKKIRLSVNSALRFAEHFPTHVHAQSVRLQAAERLYDLHDYSAALLAAGPITAISSEISGTPSSTHSKLVTSAWIIIAHSLFEQQEYLRAESAYQRLLTRTAADQKQRKRYQEKLAASIYKQAERARNLGQLEQAAETFLRVSQQVAGSEVAALARYDAASIYLGMRAWVKSIQILEKWRTDYPEHKLSSEVREKLAVLYRENGQYVLAATEFSQLASAQSDAGLQRESGWAAARLFRQANSLEESIRAYKQYIKKYPQPLERSLEARQALVELYEKTGAISKKQYWQRKIVAVDQKAGKQRTERSRFLAANAKLALVHPQANAYRKIQLREPLRKTLAEKKRLMKAVVQGYTQAASYEVSSVTTSATYEIAEIYADFGQALLTSERPKNLNEEEREQYGILLEEQAYPFEEQAIEFHESNLQRLGEGIYDQWIKQSLNKLAILLPVRYEKVERGEIFVTTE